MSMKIEHPGAIVARYYHDVASARFTDFPDRAAITKDDRSTISYHDLDGVRLATIKSGSLQTQYMRFFGLAGSITQHELSRIGVRPYEAYPDLVVACDSPTNEFTVVPTELRHHMRRLQKRLVPLGATRPPHIHPIDTWPQLKPGKYTSGIYSAHTRGEGLLDIRPEMPELTDACMSIAQLLVAQEAGIKELFIAPDEPSA